MQGIRDGGGRGPRGDASEAVFPADDRGGADAVSGGSAERPLPHVRVVDRTAIVRLGDGQMLFEEPTVEALNRLFRRLIDEGLTRLVVDFTGVPYVSGAVLGLLAEIQHELAPVGGRIRLCGLDPLAWDMLRITRLDRVFDVQEGEAEAPGRWPR
jgi:anti-sigma B factor antagonist